MEKNCIKKQKESHEYFIKLQNKYRDHILVPSEYFFKYRKLGYYDINRGTEIRTGNKYYTMMKEEIKKEFPENVRREY